MMGGSLKNSLKDIFEKESIKDDDHEWDDSEHRWWSDLQLEGGNCEAATRNNSMDSSP